MANTPETSAPVAPAVRTENDRQQLPRERSTNFGGPRLKLKVAGQIEGHHLVWENDEDAAIEQLLEEGFDFVAPEEVNMQSATQSRDRIVGDADLADRVSRVVGTLANGNPLRAYLMKCTNDTWAEREASIQAQADHWDSAILKNEVENVPNRYVPRGYDTKIVSGTRR